MFRACSPASRAVVLMAGSLLTLPLSAQVPQEGEDDLLTLLQIPIISASKTPERLAEAPAMVVVLTREDLARRGYTQISEILDDLPGMDVVRPQGDTFLKVYWRGFRNNVGEPFLVLLDGIPYNNLYLNTARDPLLCVSIQSLQRVEVVYGPASAVYGSNAFRGILNLITRNAEVAGTSGGLSITGGTKDRRILDGYFAWRQGDLSLSAAIREDRGLVDDTHVESSEFLKGKYLQDRRIWGSLLDNPALAGRFKSEWQFQDLDLRLRLGGTEVGYNRMLMATGNGYQYAGDRGTPQPLFFFPTQSFHIRHQASVASGVESITTFRTLDTDIRPDSITLNGGAFEEGESAGRDAGSRWVQLATYQIRSSSTLIRQEFDLRLVPKLGLFLGLESERRDLQKAYEFVEGPMAPVVTIASAPYPVLPPLVPTPNYQNRIRTTHEALFGLARFYFMPGHSLVAGLRSDRDSVYGTSSTFRGGWVANLGGWGYKAMVGEAYREPTPRTLFGGWSGAGSDPNLKPEFSRTWEFSASHSTSSHMHALSFWDTRDRDVIVTRSAGSSSGRGAMNIGTRRFQGLDYRFQLFLFHPRVRQITLWGWWSHFLTFQEYKYRYDAASSRFDFFGWGRVGDLARNKGALGGTVALDSRYDITARGRYVGPRVPVDSNPIRHIGGYSTLDLFIRAKWKNASLGLALTNLLDRQYFQPGIYGADAGDTPGSFTGTGLADGKVADLYSGGSRGLFNSLLPQAGRSARLSFTWTF